VSNVRADEEENDDADCSAVHRENYKDSALVTWSEATGLWRYIGVANAVVLYKSVVVNS
jgi:hypothetical protein